MSEPEKSRIILSLDEFVRSISVNRHAPHSFFLGAGASIKSGVASADRCIWEWKREIFLSHNPGVEDQFGELSQSTVREKIQKWLDAEGSYIQEGDSEEYGFYAKACYPIAENRRHYFKNLVSQARPSIGYKVLCLLAKEEIVQSVWTTNFDGLTLKAAPETDVTVIDVSLDSAHRINNRQYRRGELIHVALHGDFKYDALKNTEEELKHQDEELRNALVTTLGGNNMIVLGYSGRDDSIMEVFEEAYSKKGGGWLYWCGYGSGAIPPKVKRLIDLARQNGRHAYYVQTEGFEDVMHRLALRCLTDSTLTIVNDIRAREGLDPRAETGSFSIQIKQTGAVIKSNAYALEAPSELLQFEWSGSRSEGAWKRLRNRIEEFSLVAGLQRGKVLAIGTIDDVQDAFGEEIIGRIERTPIDEKELARSSGVVISMLKEAIVKALAEKRGLNRLGRGLLWKKEATEKRRIGRRSCFVHEAAVFDLKYYAGNQYIVIKPTIVGRDENGELLDREDEKELKRQVLTRQYNKQFNDALNQWREILFPEGSITIEYPPDVGSSFRFNIASVPIFAKIGAQPGGRTVKIPPSVERHVRSRGLEIKEPDLLFSNSKGDNYVRDSNPIRGVTNNKPYDYVLESRGLGSPIRIGVICPERGSPRLSQYLQKLQRPAKIDSKEEYLIDYPGFNDALNTTITIPEPYNNAWISPNEKFLTNPSSGGTLQLARSITQAIDALRSTEQPHVIFIYIPRSWKPYESFTTESQVIDLHDFVKAYAIQRGIATQFIREATLEKRHQGEVIWWLALSMYVKAMRTPWVLADIDDNTAFMGLGFSIEKGAEAGKHILLGCSHIYNAQGVGLNFRLSKIEDPMVTRQGNPFMSREDARRMAENTVQLYFQSRGQLPERVVVHKRTPFKRDEVDGLLEGFGAIKTVDMLEVNIEPSLRYVASRVVNGKFTGDGFPVKRGTAIQLEKKRALIWVHGTTEAVKAGRKYYQGKSRIPAPLVVKRHYGQTSLSTIATEILGLSKMNWNSFDLYTKLPATVQSSNEIARIGGLLERLGSLSYDYRLFI